MRPRTYTDRVEIKVYLEREMREAIERAVGHGNRSAFVTEAVREALRKIADRRTGGEGGEA